MLIDNILVSELLKVLNELPEGTKKIDIEYDLKRKKIIIYPVPDSNKRDKSIIVDIPKIDPSDDLIDYID